MRQAGAKELAAKFGSALGDTTPPPFMGAEPGSAVGNLLPLTAVASAHLLTAVVPPGQEMAPEMSGTFSELPELPGMAMAMSGGLTVAAAEALGSHGQVVAASSDSVQHPAAMGAAEPVGITGNLGVFDDVVAMLSCSSESTRISGDMSIASPSRVATGAMATDMTLLTQLLPSPPLLRMVDVPWCLQPLPIGWTEVLRDGNARLLKRFGAGGRTMWATATDVPASPQLVAAGLRHVFREWGERDPLVASVRVVSEGNGAPEWMTECSGVFEQILHAVCAPPRSCDCVLRSVWALADGAHACSIRAAPPQVATHVPPPAQAMPRDVLAADVWVLANPEEPGSALFHSVIDAGELGAALLQPEGAQQLLGWTRRVIAAAIFLKSRVSM